VWLTRLELSWHDWVRRGFNNPAVHHGFLWNMFEKYQLEENQPEFTYSYHLDRRRPDFLVASWREPMVNWPQWVSSGVRAVVRRMPEGVFEVGRTYGFVSRLSPQMSVCEFLAPTERVRRRVPLPDGEVPAWVDANINRDGRAVWCACGVEAVEMPQTAWTRSGDRITSHVVRVAGAMRVLDSELFERRLVFGIGRGKRYGLGMLVLPEIVRELGV